MGWKKSFFDLPIAEGEPVAAHVVEVVPVGFLLAVAAVAERVLRPVQAGVVVQIGKLQIVVERLIVVAARGAGIFRRGRPGSEWMRKWS